MQEKLPGEAWSPFAMSAGVQDSGGARAPAIANREPDDCERAWFSLLQHELRTPLTGLLALAAELRLAGLDSTERQKVAALEAAARQLAGMIERLVPAPGAGPARASFGSAPFDGIEFLDNIVLSHWLRAARQGTGLHLLIDPAVPRRWFTDSGRLRQILDNLLANAVAATPHGCVLLEVRLAEEPLHGSRELELSVQDTGAGLGDAPVETLFGWGARGPDAAARHPAGAGIGLFVCRWLAGELGGRITYRPRAGCGSVFSLTLPAGIGTGPEADGMIRSAALARFRCAVALADPVNRIAMSVLERLGIPVREAIRPDWERVARGLEALLCDRSCLAAASVNAPAQAESSAAVLVFRGPRARECLQLMSIPQPLLFSSAAPLLLEAAVASRLRPGRGWPGDLSDSPDSALPPRR